MASRFVLTAQVQLQAPTNTRQVVNQIQRQLSGVNVKVNLQGGQQAAKQVNNLNKATKQATTQANKMGKAFGASIRRFGAFTIATRAVSLFTNSLANATKEAIDFEREMIKISQVTGKTLGQLKGLENTITNLATSLGVSSKSILSVGRILSQAGVQAKDLNVALTTLAKTELAPTFDDITQTAEGAVAILAQFGEGVGALERQLGAINRVAGQFAVESGDLISVIRRTGGVFKAAGGDLEELIALFTSVRATTRESAESIATGLRTIFTRIQRPRTIEFLKQFGVELTDLNGKFVGPFEAIRQLSGALSGLEQGDIRFVRIAEELGGFRQIGKVIPLLQQFETAEKARQAALEGGTSLDDDAAKAQAALAVQIARTKEEFLALIRSFTQTSSFQLFVKSSLELASALIKIADALKPLIPLLATFGAIKFARGAAGFARGIGAGLKGGSPTGFAAGGMVPGTGNRDTVPAMLTPGEFVIRKSSVKSLGAGTLAAMNNNRYALGGTVGGIGLNPFGGKAPTGKGTVKTKDILSTLVKNTNLAGGIAGNRKLISPDGTPTKLARNKGLADDLLSAVNSVAFNSASAGSRQQSFTAIGATFPSTANSESSIEDLIKQKIKSSFTDIVRSGGIVESLQKAIQSAGGPKVGLGRFNKRIIESIGIEDSAGKIFEAAVSRMGAPFDEGVGKSDLDDFDFINGVGGNLAQFAPFAALENIPVDAKKTLTKGILNDIASKKTKNTLAAQVNTSADFQRVKKLFDSTSVKKRATGGGISGSDTVPAMLTPGEFVFSKSAAQSIGYSNLNRMNKQGVKGFAKGGAVQYFNSGTTGSGASFTPSSSPIISPSIARSFDKMGKTTEKQISIKEKLLNLETKFTNSVNSRSEKIQNSFDKITNKSAKELSRGLQDLSKKGVRAVIKPFESLAKSTSTVTGKLLNMVPGLPSLGGRRGRSGGASAPSPDGSGGSRDAMGAVFAISMLTGMIPDIENADRGFGALGNSLKQSVALFATLGLAVSSFGVKMNKQAFLTQSFGKNLMSAAGVAVLIGVAFNGVLKAIDAFRGTVKNAEEAQEKAIKTGSATDIAAAQSAANQVAASEAVNKAGLGATVALAGVGFMLGGPFGAAIGGLIGGIGTLAVKFGVGGEALQGFLSNLGLAPTASQIKAQTNFTIQSARAQKALADSAKEAAEELKEIEAGTISATQSLGAGGAAAKAASAIGLQSAAAKELIRANEQQVNQIRSSGFASFIDTFTGKSGSLEQANKQLQKEQIKASQDFIAGQSARFAAATKEQVVASNAAGQSATFDDFLNSLDPSIKAVIENTDKMNGNSDEMDKLRKNFENQKKAVIENIKFIKAMNFGLSEVTSGIKAYSSSLNNLVAAQETGFSTAAFAAQTLATAISSSGKLISSAELGRSLDALENNLKKFGANAEQITDARALITGLNDLQKNAADALLAVKSGFKGGTTSPEAIKNQLRDAIIGSIPDSSPIKQKLIDSFGKLTLPPEAIQEFLNTGDVSVILDKAFGPIQEQVEKQLLGPLQEMAKQEQILVGLTRKRRDAEQKLITVQRQAIDTQIEAAKAFEEFGGAAFTSEKELDARRQQANLVLRDAGVAGLSGGSAADIRAASDQILSTFSSQQRLQNRAAAGGGGAFGGAEGVDEDRRRELKASNQALLTFTKQSIEARKQELELINKKNQAEKQALESLLTGDIESFFNQAIGAAAGSALRSGNAQVAGLFGAGALGRGLQGLQGTGLTDSQNKRAASIAFSAFGLGDNAARVFTGTTREEERIKAEGRELAILQSELANQSAEMESMTVQASEVVISAANVRLTEIGQQVSSAQAALNFNRGGTVYANRGMFIPRGTDTVPAMLTPGEFVVNRAAVARGNNLQILRAMNSNSAPIQAAQGFSGGGAVRYRAGGSTGPEPGGGMDFSKFEELVNKFQEVTDKLGNVNIKHMFDKLGTLDINHMFNGNMQQAFKDEILAEAGNMMSRSKFNSDGSITTSDRSVLG